MLYQKDTAKILIKNSDSIKINDKKENHNFYSKNNDTATFLKLPYKNVKQYHLIDSTYEHTNPKNKLIFYDSIYYNNSDKYIESIFQNHTLKPDNLMINKSIQRINFYSDWFFSIILICTILIILLKTFFSSKFNIIFKSFYIHRFYIQLIKDYDILKDRIIFPIFFLYYLVITTIIYFVSNFYYNITSTYFTQLNIFLIIFSILVISNMIRTLIIKLTGIIFNISESTIHHRIILLIYSFLVGISVFPLLLFYSNSQNTIFLIAITILISIFYLSRTIIGIYNIRRNINFFKIFLYFCTIDILPNLIIIKFILNYGKWLI